MCLGQGAYGDGGKHIYGLLGNFPVICKQIQALWSVLAARAGFTPL